MHTAMNPIMLANGEIVQRHPLQTQNSFDLNHKLQKTNLIYF